MSAYAPYLDHSSKNHTFVSFSRYIFWQQSTFHMSGDEFSAHMPSLSHQTTQNCRLLLLFSCFGWFNVCNLKPFQLYWIFSAKFYFVASSLFFILRLIFCFIWTSKKKIIYWFSLLYIVDLVVLLQRARFSLLFSIHAKEHFINSNKTYE